MCVRVYVSWNEYIKHVHAWFFLIIYVNYVCFVFAKGSCPNQIWLPWRSQFWPSAGLHWYHWMIWVRIIPFGVPPWAQAVENGQRWWILLNNGQTIIFVGFCWLWFTLRFNVHHGFGCLRKKRKENKHIRIDWTIRNTCIICPCLLAISVVQMPSGTLTSFDDYHVS